MKYKLCVEVQYPWIQTEPADLNIHSFWAYRGGSHLDQLNLSKVGLWLGCLAPKSSAPSPQHLVHWSIFRTITSLRLAEVVALGSRAAEAIDLYPPICLHLLSFIPMNSSESEREALLYIGLQKPGILVLPSLPECHCCWYASLCPSYSLKGEEDKVEMESFEVRSPVSSPSSFSSWWGWRRTNGGKWVDKWGQPLLFCCLRPLPQLASWMGLNILQGTRC